MPSGEHDVTVLTFYTQARRDGGVRTALEINDNTVLARFQSGDKDDDPTLDWFVDLEFKGKGVPKTAERAREWLLERGDETGGVLRSLADELRAGVDVESLPFERVVLLGPGGVRMRIVCSAARRVNARRIADVLRRLAARWDEQVRGLQAD